VEREERQRSFIGVLASRVDLRVLGIGLRRDGAGYWQSLPCGASASEDRGEAGRRWPVPRRHGFDLGRGRYEQWASLGFVKTVVLDPLPIEVEQLMKRRKRLGLDLYDEVWEGTYHMAPMARLGHGQLQAQVLALLEPLAERVGLLVSGPFNLGQLNDFRVPDGGLYRGESDPDTVYLDTAALVVEIVSVGDETYDKLPFYAARQVNEVLVVDATERRVQVLVLTGDAYRDAECSTVLGIQASEIEAGIRWPWG